MKYEAGTSIVNTHTIESSNKLCCAETGRVVAVFYNDYDLDSVIELEKEIEELKKTLVLRNQTIDGFLSLS
jgi:hypothetical protein